ncbi:MAG: NERD domain-containing protein [Betaproteobacteria bacterium]|nr:NERD domain-containing protein [Betaproteobacteria bacterium]
MPMSLSRWQAVSPVSVRVEREALDWLRNHLPDREPWHAWTNFEFIDEEGKVNEVDALILTPAGLFIEIKSRPGVAFRRCPHLAVDYRWSRTCLRQPADPRQPQIEATRQPVAAAA